MAGGSKRRAPEVVVARAYDEELPHGYRVLVDRLWPRGVSKERLPLDRWAREVAPSADLRRWYGHAPERFEEFAGRYRAELEADEGRRVVAELVEAAGGDPLVLVTATRDVDRSGAVVLAGVITGRSG